MAKQALVYGGAGQLGEAVVAAFAAKGWTVSSVDFRESKAAATSHVLKGGDVEEDVTAVLSAIGDTKFDALVNVAGGWAGGSINAKGIFAGVDKMWKFNVQSAVAAGHIASKTLAPGGLLVLTGASAALGPTPGMIAYGITKAATHHLVQSLAQSGSGLPENAGVVAVCPVCLDTATNRQGMPDADFSSWTPLSAVADKVFEWANGQDRPATGSLVEIVTKNSETEFKVHA